MDPILKFLIFKDIFESENRKDESTDDNYDCDYGVIDYDTDDFVEGYDEDFVEDYDDDYDEDYDDDYDDEPDDWN